MSVRHKKHRCSLNQCFVFLIHGLCVSEPVPKNAGRQDGIHLEVIAEGERAKPYHIHVQGQYDCLLGWEEDRRSLSCKGGNHVSGAVVHLGYMHTEIFFLFFFSVPGCTEIKWDKGDGVNGVWDITKYIMKFWELFTSPYMFADLDAAAGRSTMVGWCEGQWLAHRAMI